MSDYVFISTYIEAFKIPTNTYTYFQLLQIQTQMQQCIVKSSFVFSEIAFGQTWNKGKIKIYIYFSFNKDYPVEKSLFYFLCYFNHYWDEVYSFFLYDLIMSINNMPLLSYDLYVIIFHLKICQNPSFCSWKIK